MLALFCSLLEVLDSNRNNINFRPLPHKIRENEVRKPRSASSLGRRTWMVLGAFFHDLHPCDGSHSVVQAKRKPRRAIESVFGTKGRIFRNESRFIQNIQIPRHVFKQKNLDVDYFCLYFYTFLSNKCFNVSFSMSNSASFIEFN